jgi:hypothetical protein
MFDVYPGPYWVSAASAVTEHGDLDDSLFPTPRIHRYIERHLQQFRLSKKAPGDKISWSECFEIERPPCCPPQVAGRHQRTFDDLVKYSEAIFQGTILEVTPGFLGGRPTAVVSVRIDSWLKESSHFPEIDRLYMEYPVARFSVAGISYCVDDPNFPMEPAKGLQVLAFPFQKPWDERKQFLSLQHKMLFIEGQSGSLEKPKDLALDEVAEHITSFSRLVDDVNRRLSELQIVREQP